MRVSFWGGLEPEDFLEVPLSVLSPSCREALETLDKVDASDCDDRIGMIAVRDKWIDFDPGFPPITLAHWEVVGQMIETTRAEEEARMDKDPAAAKEAARKKAAILAVVDRHLGKQPDDSSGTIITKINGEIVTVPWTGGSG